MLDSYQVTIKRETMSLVPTFELGYWNAWILVIPMLVIFFCDVKASAARESEKAKDFKLSKKEERLANAPIIVMFIAFFYAIFLPLQSTAIWLYGGLVSYFFGILFEIIAVLNLATSPKDRVITGGLYRFSRNPMYIGMLLMHFGLGIASASWLYIVFTLMLFFLLNEFASAEERYCLYIYGDDYLRYKNRTPRWIGIPKSEKSNLR